MRDSRRRPSDDGETGWIHCRTLDNINRRQRLHQRRQRNRKISEAHRCTCTRVNEGQGWQGSPFGESQWHQSHLDPPTSAKKKQAESQKERKKSRKGKQGGEIGIRRTLNHDVDCVYQKVFKMGQSERRAEKWRDGGKKKRHYHYPPYPTTPAYPHR